MTHLQREIDRLKRKVLALGALVEENLRQAIQAIDQRDAATARRVIATDVLIDQNEVDVEEDCLKILALYQPVAGDLRFVAAVIKINSELERIGDLSANIAERALQLLDEHPVTVPHLVAVMADRTWCILEKALDALVHQDAVTARQVLVADDEVDELYARLIGELKAVIRADLEHLDAIVLLFSVARYLERLADHATNIAEDVLYMVEGEIQRHNQATAPRGAAEGLPELGDRALGARLTLAGPPRVRLADRDGSDRRLGLAAGEVVLGRPCGADGLAVQRVARLVATGEALRLAHGGDLAAAPAPCIVVAE